MAVSGLLGVRPPRASVGRLQVGSVKWKLPLPPQNLGAAPTHSPSEVLWAPVVLPWLPGGWGGDCVNQ